MTGTIRLARSSSSPATSFPSTDNGGQWCCRSQLNHPLRKLAQQLASSHQASSCEMSINLRPWRLRPLFNDFLYPLCIIHQLSEVVDNLEVYHRWALHHKSKRGARTATVFYGTLEETINVGRIISNIWTTRSSMSFVCIDHPLWFACWMVRIPSWVKELGCSLMAKDFVWYIKKKHGFCLFQSLLFYLLLNLFGKGKMSCADGKKSTNILDSWNLPWFGSLWTRHFRLMAKVWQPYWNKKAQHESAWLYAAQKTGHETTYYGDNKVSTPSCLVSNNINTNYVSFLSSVSWLL